MDNKGQVTKQILAVVISGIALVIGVYVFNEVGGFTTDYNDHSYALSDTTFSENIENSAVSPWTVENSNNSVVTWDDTKKWINVQDNPSDNTGLDYIDNVTQSVSVSTYYQIKSATVKGATQVAVNDNLTDADIYIKLVDPSSNTDTIWQKTDTQGTTGTWWTTDNDVSSLIDEDGSYTLRLEVHMATDDNDATHEINADNLSLSVTSQEQTNVHSIENELQNAYGMVPIVLIVLVASMIITVLLQFRR